MGSTSSSGLFPVHFDRTGGTLQQCARKQRAHQVDPALSISAGLSDVDRGNRQARIEPVVSLNTIRADDGVAHTTEYFEGNHYETNVISYIAKSSSRKIGDALTAGAIIN